MHVLILAAGYGMRLRPLTLVYPKATIPMLNVPLLQLQIDRVSSVAFDVIYVNRHYLKERFPPAEVWDSSGTVVYLDEPDVPLGTGGAIRNLWNQTGRQDDVLVINVDTLNPADLGVFVAFANTVEADAVLAVRPAPDASIYTTFAYDPETHRLTPSPDAFGTSVIYAGVALLRTSALAQLPDADISDWFRDAVQPAWADGRIQIVGWQMPGPWWDLGHAERFLEVYGDLVQTWQTDPSALGILRPRIEAAGRWMQPGLWVHSTAAIDETTVRGWAVVGPGSHVNQSHLELAIIDAGARVERASVRRGFISRGVTVSGFPIEDAIVALDPSGSLQLWQW